MKYVLGVLGFIILAVIAVVLLASTTGNRTVDNQTGEKIVNLVDYVNNGEVTYTTEGRIVGDEEYKSIRITISPTQRRAQVLSGYTDRVEKEQNLSNNSEAFDTFMRALGNAGYSRERKQETEVDMRGSCPLGNRYIYQLRQGGETPVDLWSNTCGSREGSFGGNAGLVRQLFQNQIPDYYRFISNVRL